MINFIQKTRRGIAHLESGILFLLFMSLLGLAFGQVILRNFFDASIVWADVAVRILVLWVTVFGAMVATRQHEHIRIDLVPRLLHGRARHALRVFYLFVAMAVAFAVAFYSFEIVKLEWAYPDTAFANVPTWLTQAIIPFGFAVIGLRFMCQSSYALYLLYKGAE